MEKRLTLFGATLGENGDFFRGGFSPGKKNVRYWKEFLKSREFFSPGKKMSDTGKPDRATILIIFREFQPKIREYLLSFISGTLQPRFSAKTHEKARLQRPARFLLYAVLHAAITSAQNILVKKI